MLAHRWARSPHLVECTLELIGHQMEDVALGHAWEPFREVMHIHSTLDIDISTLDVEHMDDDIVCYDAFMMVGDLLAIMVPL